jgi:putative membrane protein
MLAALLIRWAILAVAFAVTSWLLSGMEVSGGVWGYIWVSALFGIANAILGTILRIITLPLTLVTLGLFSLVVTAIMLSITDALSSHLTIDEFWWTAIWAAIILAFLTVIIDVVLLGLVRRARPATV